MGWKRVTIEERLQALEAQAHKAPSTNHGERLTALENAVKELQLQQNRS